LTSTSYLTEGNDRKAREVAAQLDSIKREIDATETAIAKIDSAISALQDELSTANSLKSNISANIRYRNELKEIEKVQAQLDEIDLVQAARSRREFNQKYSGMLEDEKNKQTAVSHGNQTLQQSSHVQWNLASGELVQMTKNREKLAETLRIDYKDIDKKYKEQLIKTKVSCRSVLGDVAQKQVSEFANNDLEKYGKALDK
jgi:DNA repair protein RAD50